MPVILAMNTVHFGNEGVMRILVAGGSGFLGNALIASLTSEGHEVVGFSRTDIPGSLVGDITDATSIISSVKEYAPDVIFNLASQTDLSASNGALNYDANTVGVRNLIEAVSQAPSVRRVIWASSQLINKPGVCPKHDEDYNPVGGYGESKVEGERLVRRLNGGGKIWTIVRPTTVWGPGMSPHYLRLLSMIRRGLYFHVGSRQLQKSYSYIENLVHQLRCLSVADTEAIQAKTFYLADSEPIELREWCDGFARAFGKTIPSLPKPIVIAMAKAGDLAGCAGVKRVPFNSQRLNNILTEYVFDTGPIDAICGKSQISNSEGVARTAKWYLDRQSRD
jgi:nucleoside-diphosphate-sugar epimerase